MIKEFVKVSQLEQSGDKSATEGKLSVTALRKIYAFNVTPLDGRGDVTITLGDLAEDEKNTYAIVLHYTGNSADSDGMTAQYCRIASDGKLTAHFNSLGPVAVIVTNCDTAQYLVNTYARTIGTDANYYNQNNEAIANSMVEGASAIKDSQISVPEGSKVVFNGGVTALTNTAAIESFKGILNNILNLISADSVLQVLKFELPASGSGEIGMFVGNTFSGKIVIVYHYNEANGSWDEPQQKKVDANGYIYPYFDSFSPISLVITDRTEAISNISTTNNSTSTTTAASTSSSSSSSGGSSGGSKTIQIGSNGAGITTAAPVTPSLTDTDKVLPAGTKMTTAVLTSGDEYNRAITQIAPLVPTGNQCVLEDISLADAQGAALHELNGYVSITIPLPFAPKAGNTIAVYRVAEDGTNVLCAAAIEGNALTFKTNHFSTYAFVEVPAAAANTADAAGVKSAAGKGAASPKTADDYAVMLLAIAALAAAGTLVMTKKRSR